MAGSVHDVRFFFPVLVPAPVPRGLYRDGGDAGPITFATGSLASLQGFRKTLPLLAGIGIGRVVLLGLMAFGAVRLAASLSLPVANICGALVLCAMALRMARIAPPTSESSSGTLVGKLFGEGMLIGFLSPPAASLIAVAFVGFMLAGEERVDWLPVTALATIVTVGWYVLVAAFFSRPMVRDAAVRRYRLIRAAAVVTLGAMALHSTLSAFLVA